MSLATKIFCKVVKSRVSIPTWTVLYLNVFIAALILGTPWIAEPGTMAPPLTPWGGIVWSLALLVASLVSTQGLIAHNPHTVALGAFGGFLVWGADFFAYVASGLFLADMLSLIFALPMMACFAYIYIRHSFLDLYIKEHKGNGEDEIEW